MFLRFQRFLIRDKIAEALEQKPKHEAMIYFIQDRRNFLAEKRILTSDMNAVLNDLEEAIKDRLDVYSWLLLVYEV